MTESTAEARPRVAVMGGGVAGVSLAWLLDGACDVVLLEANERLGGHAHTVEVEYRGRPFRADLGAQFVSPRLQPRFMHLLEELGVYDASAPDSGGTVTRDVSTTVGDCGERRPRFVSPMPWRRIWPLFALWNLPAMRAFYAFVRAVRPFERDGDWSIPLDDWLRSVRGLDAEQREHLILPWLTALTGCAIDAERGMSARAAVAPVSRTLPDGPSGKSFLSNVVDGLGGVVDQLALRCTTLTLHRKARVLGFERTPSGLCVGTEDGRRVEVEHVVFAAPPHALVRLFAAQPDVERWLGRFTYFPSQLVIHDQPTFMPQDRRTWSAYNALVTGGYCEASVWYGALRDALPDGSSIDLFKSWVSARSCEPGGVLASAEYLHPLVTPEFVRAQSELERWQGRGNVWFAGSWTHDVDLQETAFGSALHVAERIAPGARNLQRFLGRVQRTAVATE